MNCQHLSMSGASPVVVDVFMASPLRYHILHVSQPVHVSNQQTDDTTRNIY